MGAGTTGAPAAAGAGRLDDPTADRLTELAQEAIQQGWWTDYQDLGVPYIGLEQHASSITSYTMQYFPALQTREYARAIITAITPQIEPKILEQRVEARLRRQHVLKSPNNLRYASTGNLPRRLT